MPRSRRRPTVPATSRAGLALPRPGFALLSPVFAILSTVFALPSAVGPVLFGLALAPAARAGDPLPAGVLEGRVTRVIDGDTLEILSGRVATRIRIAGIDTPERGQPWASRAKRALSERVFGKQVRVIEVSVDGWGRTVGRVYADNVCVGCELVREGHAWVYRGRSDEPVLLELEADARAARRGLWSLPEADRIPPWEWRDSHRHPGRRLLAEPGATPESRECGSKRDCREMISCAEARHHLEVCGLTRLDGDGDGVPCEALCDPR